ncbi:MAG: hypothetical protein LBG09_03115 [Puniceicoccales bacterium]|nr:hypothetical protein [Puniceicoccales bacterium]
MHRRRVDGRRQDSAPPELALPDEHVEKKSHRRRHRKQQDSAPPELALTSGGIEPFPLMLQERRPVLLPRISTDHVSDRRPTMTDFLSERGDHRMSAEDQEQNLAQTIKEFIVRYTREAVPEFVTFIVDGFERAQRKSDQEEQRDALERMLRLRLLNQETFKYITHGAQSPQEAMLMFEQAGEFVQGQTGAIYKIKCRVMDETLLIIRRFIYPDIPDEAVAELEEYIDNLLLPLSNALVDVVFELLRDDTFAPTGCCGCCKKLSSDDKRLIAGGAIQMTGAILGKVFGSGFEQGANIVAQGICGSIQRSRSNED